MDLRVLFIDDDSKSVEIAQEALRQQGINCEFSTFESAQEIIEKFSPEIISLDMYLGNPSNKDYAGINQYDSILKKIFCPTIIYSAHPEIITDERGSHPLIRLVKKGSSSEEKLLSEVVELYPYVVAIREAKKHISEQFTTALRDISPYVFSEFSEPSKQIEIIRRCGRRRLAAFMDSPLEKDETLESWEQYIHPPIDDDPKLGDIIYAGKMVDCKPANYEPENYGIILSPSCDLVRSGGRIPKVSQVLSAFCIPSKVGLDKSKLSTETVKQKKNLKQILIRGYQEPFIFLPYLKGKIPAMVVDLKNLALIPIDKIGTEGEKFYRIASIDSPFREMISWAYMQSACRPGLPERNVDSWLADIDNATKS